MIYNACYLRVRSCPVCKAFNENIVFMRFISHVLKRQQTFNLHKIRDLRECVVLAPKPSQDCSFCKFIKFKLLKTKVPYPHEPKDR